MPFYKEVNYDSPKEMFDFLSNHFTYDTMNSWNGIRSIANNVKVYNLDVDYEDAMDALQEDDYFSINRTIEDWEADHPEYEVGFNGRSGGYLVLTRKQKHLHVFKEDNCYPGEYENYEYWMRDIEATFGSYEEYKPTLIEEVKIVQAFDKLCDELVDVLRALIVDMNKRKSLTRKYSATLRFQRYDYETKEDLKLHMLDMKNRGFGVYEYDEDDLWAEYEMNEAINSEVVLDDEGEDPSNEKAE